MISGLEWQLEPGVDCVVAPCCAFTFDAYHTKADGSGYSCPLCAEIRLEKMVVQLQADVTSLQQRLRRAEYERDDAQRNEIRANDRLLQMKKALATDD